jgi:hypothetical protein
MSALEGLVAAIELFQDLELTSQAKLSKYIVHLAHSPPDVAINPLWNKIPELDDVTWETLSEEFAKVRPPESSWTFCSLAVAEYQLQPRQQYQHARSARPPLHQGLGRQNRRTLVQRPRAP